MMTNLLHGAHVANKLFSTIARLRLLLVMFVALSVSAEVWGATATLTLSSSKKFGTTSGSTLTDDQNNTWTCNGSNIQNTYNTTYKGQQFGTSKNAGNYTFACTIAGATISSVKITAAAGSTNAKYSISVGGSSKYSGKLSKTSTTYGGTNASGSGEISISLQGSGTGAAVYLGSITVVYTTASATKHTVTFNAGSNGTCSTPSLTEASAGAGVTLPNVTPNSDYRFLGWATTSAATTANAGKAGENYKPSSNITLYAIYVQQCTVQWYADGTLLEEKTYDKGSPIQAPTASVTPCEGMQHVGWTTTADYTHATELPSTFFQEDDPLGNATFNMQFYAVFAEVQESTATPTTLEETIKFTNFSGGTSTRTYESTSANWTWKKNDGSSIAEYDEIRLYAKHSMTIAPKTGCTISNIIATCTSGSYATALGGSSLDGATKTVSGSTVTITPTSGNIVITQKDQSRVSQFTVTFTTNVASGGKITNYTTTCTAKPTQLATPRVTLDSYDCTSATIKWDAVTNAKAYWYQIIKTGDTNSGVSSDSKTYTRNDLESGTSYTWSVKAIGDNDNYSDSKIATGTFTTHYSITYNTNGGFEVANDCGTTLPAELPTTTKDGFNFGGWYTDEECTKEATAGATINKNITLYAKWTPIYTVTFDAGSGTCDIKFATTANTGEVTLPTATHTCIGWIFAGWATASVNETTTAPTKLYDDNTTYQPTSNITLYAVYSKSEGEGVKTKTVTLSPPTNTSAYKEGTKTDSEGNTWSYYAAINNQSGTFEFGLNSNALNYNIGSPIFDGKVSSVSFKARNGSSSEARKFLFCSSNTTAQPQTGDLAEVSIPKSQQFTNIYTADLSQSSVSQFYIYAPKALGITAISVTYTTSGGSTPTYNSNPTCEALTLPTWVPATISHSTIKVVCGNTTSPSATGTNGPAAIIFDGSNLVSSITVTASAGFLVSTNKTDANTYKQTITINPIASGDHEGTLDNIYIIASTSKETSEDYTGTITLEGEDITDGSQTISVTADVTCLPYTLTFNDRGRTIPATYYAGALVPEPTPPTDVCTDPINYEFDGWALAIVEDGSLEYTKVDFSTFTMPSNNNTILYAVYRYASTDDVCLENQFKMVRTQNEMESGADYILAGYNGTNDYAMTKTIRKNTNSYYDVLTSIKNSEYINDDYIITLDNDEEDDFVWKITGDLTNGYQIYDEYSNKYLKLGEWYWNTYPREYFTRFDWEDTGTKFRININEEKNGAAYISFTSYYTWYFGFMYYINQPNQRIIRGTTDESHIYLYKRCSGIKYLYTTTPDCDSDCTPATDITYTTEGTSITLSWTATEPSATIILYADKNATSKVTEINNATSPYTINDLAETTTYYAQIVTNEDCTSAITEVSTERPYVEIVEWDTDHLNAYINTDEKITITLENEVQKGTPTSRVATELFFSKYFEATGNVKLLALYNGTEKAIDLTSYKIKLSVLGATSLTDKNESTDITYAQTINLNEDIPAEKRTLPAGKELILIAYANSSAGDAVPFMNPDGTQNTIDKNDAAILTCAANSTTSGWNEYIRISTGKLNFSGNDAVALFKGETLIDIIGAGDATDADVQNLSPKTDFMDAPGWYNTEGYQIQPDGTIGATKDYALSTNRCLLIRRNSVTSGNNAVTKNTTNFATLGGENCEWMGYQIPDKASACEGFEYVGGYDFSSYYSSYENLLKETDLSTRNPDGTYTVKVNLTPHACKRIIVTIKNKETQQVMAVQEYKVPIIIDTDHTTTGEKFTDLKNNLGTIIVDQNGTPTDDITPLTDEEWKAACKECDVVVRDNATLSHVTNGINHFRDMTIYPTGKLDNGNSQAITLNSLQMQSMNNEIPYAIINNDGSTIDVGNMVFIKRMDDKYWYQFSLPYDCKISDIRQLNGQSMGKYWVDWGIKEYNGKRRQTEGTAATEGQVSQYWEKVEENATLKAHHGYIIGLFTHKWASVYFTPSTTNPYRESGSDAKTTMVESWYTTNLATLAPRHHGWNFTGSPYITQFGQANAGQGMNNTLLMKGEINQGSIDQEYINTENVYVTIPDLPDGLTYTQAIASTTTIKPFTAYFVQTIDVTGNSDATRTLTYDKTGRSLPSSAPARAAATKQRVLVELNITAPDGQTDNTGIWVDERYTTDYEIAADLTKMYVAGTKPQLYTIAVDNEKLAYNALPDNAAAYIPLGLYAPVAGDYTLTLDERVSRIAGAESIELLYNNQLVANLLYQDYTITANKGTVNGYSLSIRRRAGVSTAVDNTTGNTITVIANDGYISLVGVPTDAQVSIYDMVGRLINTQYANGETVVNMPIVPQGVYNIVVANGNGYTTIKSVVK